MSKVRVLFALILLFISQHAIADPNFIVLQPHEPLPENQFIFTVMNTKTGETHFGYMTAIPVDPSRRIDGALPGHTKLIAYAIGVSETEYVENHIPATKMGVWAGGGFFNTAETAVVHAQYSMKSAGLLEPFVHEKEPPTVNPVLPFVNALAPYLLHSQYWYDFFRAIAKRANKPFELDLTRLDRSPYFNWNYEKNGGANMGMEQLLAAATLGFTDVIREINSEKFGSMTRFSAFGPGLQKDICFGVDPSVHQ